MDVHFRAAMELVDRARQDVEPARALSIYARLHRLDGPDADLLFQRVLVSLGRRSTPRSYLGDTPREESGAETPQSVVAQIRKRLRGRVNLELREWVEYHTGRTETDLLWAHVENAVQFVELLQPVMAVGEAVETYTASLGVPGARAEIIYYLVLAHRSAGTAPTSTTETRAARLSVVRNDSSIRSIRGAARRREAHSQGNS